MVFSAHEAHSSWPDMSEMDCSSMCAIPGSDSNLRLDVIAVARLLVSIAFSRALATNGFALAVGLLFTPPISATITSLTLATIGDLSFISTAKT